MSETANEAGRVRVKREGPIYRIVHQGTVNLAGLKPGERPVVLSLGGGLDSWWTGLMLFLSPDPYLRELRRRLALIIHADLGAEWPETYGTDQAERTTNRRWAGWSGWRKSLTRSLPGCSNSL